MKKNILKIGKIGLPALATAFPVIALAAGKTLADIMTIIVGYFKNAIILIIGLAVVTFVWNIYRYFFTEKNKTEAGMYVLYSITGFFVILSLWGLVALLTRTFELTDNPPTTWPFGAGGSNTTINNQNTGLSTPQVH